jgi:hypothetical protein
LAVKPLEHIQLALTKPGSAVQIQGNQSGFHLTVLLLRSFQGLILSLTLSDEAGGPDPTRSGSAI